MMFRFPAALVLILTAVTATASAQTQPPVNLVPDHANRSPDYFCTWNVQGFVCSYRSSDAQRQAMIEQNLFGHDPHQDWVDFFPAARRDLIFVMDDSWDIPLNNDQKYFGSLILNSERFPSYTGTPTERLRKLNDAIRGKGWRGLGGWVCAQQAPALTQSDDAAYWTERLNWMNDAGIQYWKVDWGSRAHDAAWRQSLTELAAKHAPSLVVEHAMVEPCLSTAAVYRTYDVENVIAIPATIDRIAHLLKNAPAKSPTLINCEDEPYVAAGCGCAMGVMRHPFTGALPDGRRDIAFPDSGPNLKRRLDEVTRVVHWHRIADPIPLGSPDAKIDPQVLHDEWILEKDETWTTHHPGDRRSGSAPARIARGGLPLPEVAVGAGQPLPFVLGSKSPNGPVAIATVGRTLQRAYVTPKVRVSQSVGSADTIGLFGTFDQITLQFDAPVAGSRILAQDLAADKAVDITDRVKIDGNQMILEGKLISEIGLAAATKDDLSEPGMVISVQPVHAQR